MNGERVRAPFVHDAQGHATRLASEPCAWFLPPQVNSSASVTDERINELHEKVEEALATCTTEAENASVEAGPQNPDQISNLRQLNGQIKRLTGIVVGVKRRQDVVETAQVSLTDELKQISDAGAADKAKQAADNAEQDKTIKVLGDKVEEHGDNLKVQAQINEANTANQEAQGYLNEVVFGATNELKEGLEKVAANVEKGAADWNADAEKQEGVNALVLESLKVQGERLEVQSEVNEEQHETNKELEKGLKQVAADGAADAENQDKVNAAQNAINLEQHEINKEQSERIAELKAQMEEIKKFAADGADKIYDQMADSHMELAEVTGHPQQLQVAQVKLVVSK